ncbi:hypothetical protein Nmel_007002 [Mimus melanotis]
MTVATVFEIFKCCQRCLQLMAAHPRKIILPEQRGFFEGSLVNTVSSQSTLPDLTGQIAYHLPSHKLLQMAEIVRLLLRPRNSQLLVQGPAVFTEGSGRTGKATVTWEDGFGQAEQMESQETGSTQTLGLKTVTMAFQGFLNFPDFLTEGNARADRLANPAWVAPQPNKTAQTRAFHILFHQNAGFRWYMPALSERPCT